MSRSPPSGIGRGGRGATHRFEETAMHDFRENYRPSRLQLPTWLRKVWAWL
jgi:hypothetical protein